jgi:hypothetical protein
MRKYVDHSGKKFGRLNCIDIGERSSSGRLRWKCVCECGQETLVAPDKLLSGEIQSCGCLHKEICRDLFTTHGRTGQRTNRIWKGMKTRCLNPRSKPYPNYGGRGITVCKKWKSFKGFLADMGEAPPGMTLERKDNNKGYNKSNCIWIPLSKQSQNRRCVHQIPARGKIQTIREWVAQTGVSPIVLRKRFLLGLTEEQLFAPHRGFHGER